MKINWRKMQEQKAEEERKKLSCQQDFERYLQEKATEKLVVDKGDLLLKKEEDL